MTTTSVPRADSAPTRVGALRRHFADLRDTSHGEHAITRAEKERLFERAVVLLDPHVRASLDVLDDGLLLGTGTVEGTGVRRRPDGGLTAVWALSWPAQRERVGIAPVRVVADYGAGFHHPHLSGGTVGEWPLNVFDEQQAAAARPVIDAIVDADLHNLVFAADYRIVPAATAHAPRVGTGFVR